MSRLIALWFLGVILVMGCGGLPESGFAGALDHLEGGSLETAFVNEPELRFRVSDRAGLVESLDFTLVDQDGQKLSFSVSEKNVDGVYSLAVPPGEYEVMVVPLGGDREGLTVVNRRATVGRGESEEIVVEVERGAPIPDSSPAAELLPTRNPVGLTPNIVLIVLDDFDYTDVRCNQLGAWTSTPRMDQLASQGVRFTQFYSNGSKCSPTRASILTSQLPAAFGWRNVVNAYQLSDGRLRTSQRSLPAGITNLAEVLAMKGYATGLVGKWHVGESRPSGLPRQRGFAEEIRWTGNAVVAAADGNGMYWGYYLHTSSGKVLLPQKGTAGADETYLTRKLTDEAISFVQRHQGQPFFLYLGHVATHAPFHVPPAFDNSVLQYDLDTDLGKVAAMTSDLDREIGRLVDGIDALGLAANTLIIVVSDNGGVGSPRPSRSALIRGQKGSVYEGGIRVPFIARWPGTIPAGSVNLSIASTIDLLPTLADVASTSPPPGVMGRSLYDNMVSGVRNLGRDLFWVGTRVDSYADALSGGIPYEQLDDWAIRSLRWKLVSGDASNGFTPRLFDLSSGTRGEFTDVAAQNPAVVQDLHNRYKSWRRNAGDFPARLQVVNGVAELAFDERMDFCDADFSFVVDFDVQTVDQFALIAQRSGCWRLLWDRGRVVLHLFDDRPGASLQERQVTLASAGGLAPGRHRVAFTVSGHLYAAENRIPSLYVDGNLAQRLLPNEFPAGKFLFAVPSNSAPIQLGAYPDGSSRLLGTIQIPRMSALSLSRDEIWP